MSDRLCSIDGCGEPHAARGWCKKHYYCWKRNGDPTGWRRFNSPLDALANRVKEQGDCLVWTGATWASGYGVLRTGGERIAVHRYVYELANGPIPNGLVIDHACHNPACCNLDHLRLATIGQNNSNLSGAKANNKNSGARNVYRARDKFYVRIRKDRKAYYFGVHDTLEDAVIAAQSARQKLFGEFAGRA